MRRKFCVTSVHDTFFSKKKSLFDTDCRARNEYEGPWEHLMLVGAGIYLGSCVETYVILANFRPFILSVKFLINVHC